jgi:hypothetical protein
LVPRANEATQDHRRDSRALKGRENVTPVSKLTRADYALISDFRSIAIAKDILLNLQSDDLKYEQRHALKYLSDMHDMLDARIEKLKEERT